MTKRIIAIAFIFVCASVAWAILGGTIFSRTYSLRRHRGKSRGFYLGRAAEPGAADRFV